MQGIGWYLEEANMAQVSMNLLDFEVTGLHTAYEACCNKAEVRGNFIYIYNESHFVCQ